MASLSIYHLGLWLGWQILLNLVKSKWKYEDSPVHIVQCGVESRVRETVTNASSPVEDLSSDHQLCPAGGVRVVQV